MEAAKVYNEGKKTDEDIKGMLAHEIRNAINHDKEELSEKRAKAIDYFLADMKEDVPAPPNRSSVVSKDVSDTIGWMLPGIIRTFTASGRVVECEPVGPEDEDMAEQASDYLHYCFMSKSDGYRVLYEATHDSLLLKNGIVKVWWDESEDCDYHEMSGLFEEELVLATQDPNVEVLAHTENEDGTHDIKIKMVKSRGKLCFDVIEPENFGINRDAHSIEEARFSFQREEKTRSELIELGFDKDKIDGIPGDITHHWAEEEIAREDTTGDNDDSKDRSTEMIEVYECYIKTDADGDGVAETVRAIYAGGYSTGELLDWEIWEDDPPFCDIPCQPIPHRFDAISIFDETEDQQRIKTVLNRQMLDNVYAHNNPQPEVEEGSVLNTNALTAGKFGQPIIKKKNSTPINWHDTPFVADKALGAIQYADQVIERRTGVSRSTMALDPDALQNQTATAVQKAQDAAYSKIELIARNQAELGWKKVFKKALKIVVAHQDRAETIRLRGEWVNMDPRSWNADMDITINIGLGTGSRDRDMVMLQNVLQNQVMLLDRFMAVNMQAESLEMLPKLVKTMIKTGEAAGLRNADDYYPEYTPERLQQIFAKLSQPQEDPKIAAEKEKLAMEMQAKQAEMQMEGQLKQQDASIDAQIKQQEAQTEAQLDQMKAQSDIALKREQIGAELDLKERQLAAELALKEKQMAQEMAMKERLGVHKTNVSANTSDVHVGGEPG